jgi:hypothetical protein
LHNNFFFIRDLKKHATAAEIVKKSLCALNVEWSHVIWFYGRRENGNFEFFFKIYICWRILCQNRQYNFFLNNTFCIDVILYSFQSLMWECNSFIKNHLSIWKSPEFGQLLIFLYFTLRMGLKYCLLMGFVFSLFLF